MREPHNQRSPVHAVTGAFGGKRRRQLGVTILELLIVTAVLGIIAGVGIFNGRRILRGQEGRAAITSLQQTVWQGATAAAARGNQVFLERTGDVFTLTEDTTDTVLKTFELPDGVTTNWPEDKILTFTPPGKVASLDVLPSDLTMVANGRTTKLSLSLIGEVKAEAVQ